MYTHVVLQVVVMSKGSSTLRTQVRLLSCMLPHMNLELVLPGREKNKQDQNQNQYTVKNSNEQEKLTHTHLDIYTLQASSFLFSVSYYSGNVISWVKYIISSKYTINSHMYHWPA